MFPPAGAYVCRLVVLSFVRVLVAKSNTRLQGSKRVTNVRSMTNSIFGLEAHIIVHREAVFLCITLNGPGLKEAEDEPLSYLIKNARSSRTEDSDNLRVKGTVTMMCSSPSDESRSELIELNLICATTDPPSCPPIVVKANA